ncbi:MAG: hypothetical protein WC541_00145 [Dehalococcoidia bacterium]
MKILTRKDKRLFTGSLLEWWATAKRTYPWRRPGISPYEVLIAEVLLKRTTATAAARVYQELLDRWDDIEALSNADQIQLEAILTAVGLQKQRAQGLSDIAHHLVIHESSQIPCKYERLVAIPHIGNYSASAILSFGFNKPKAVIDSNVVRIFKRYFLLEDGSEKRLSVLEDIAVALIPKDHHREFNWALLDMGALVCRYSNPRHEICPLRGGCRFTTALYNNY